MAQNNCPGGNKESEGSTVRCWGVKDPEYTELPRETQAQ